MFDVEREYELLVESAYNKVTKDEFKELSYKVKNSRSAIKIYKKQKNKRKIISECNRLISYLKQAQRKINSLPYTSEDQVQDISKFVASSAISGALFNAAIPVLKYKQDTTNQKLAVLKGDLPNAQKVREVDRINNERNLKNHIRDTMRNKDNRKEYGKGVLKSVPSSVAIDAGMRLAYNAYKGRDMRLVFAKWKNKLDSLIEKNIKWAEKEKEHAKSFM